MQNKLPPKQDQLLPFQTQHTQHPNTTRKIQLCVRTSSLLESKHPLRQINDIYKVNIHPW